MPKPTVSKHRRLSISTKLTVLTVLTGGAAVFLCCAAFVANDVRRGHEAKVLNLQGFARVVGATCTTAIHYDDRKSARQTLQSLRVQPLVETACVYNAQKQPFAEYHRKNTQFAPPSQPPMTPLRFVGDSLEVTQCLMNEGQVECYVYIRSSLADLHQQRQQYVRIVTIVMMVSLAATVTLSALLQRIISRPIVRLAETAQRISSEGDYSLRVAKPSQDELGTLYDAFNAMLDQIQRAERDLHDAHNQLEARVQQRTQQLSEANLELSREIAERERAERELLAVARRAGMAEVATGVLHNVGNVLNSVNVSVSLVLEWLRKSQVVQLSRAVNLINENVDHLGDYVRHDPKGKHLPGFLTLVSQQLSDEREQLLLEVETLCRNVEHTKTIVATQQSYAGVSGVVEPVTIGELLDDALRMYSASLDKHRVQLVREECEIPPTPLEKQKVLQILINLIKNAKDSLVATQRDDLRLTIRTSLVDEQSVRIEVSDNGLGIAPEHLDRIFQHGFTTKRDGHGFGLHSCALAAQDMEGSLVARSAGPGHGATFLLELPFKAAEVLV